MNRTIIKVVVIALVSLAFVAAAVAPRLSARLTGDEYRFRVEPVDPIDPLRGAYVTLGYPDIRADAASEGYDGEDLGTLYVTLVKQGDVWVAGDYLRERPSDTPYLACDDRGWNTSCGIDSLFLAQGDAAAMEADVASGEMVAVVKVDGRGHAALVRVEPA